MLFLFINPVSIVLPSTTWQPPNLTLVTGFGMVEVDSNNRPVDEVKIIKAYITIFHNLEYPEKLSFRLWLFNLGIIFFLSLSCMQYL